MKTFDEIRDTAIKIVDELVKQGFVKRIIEVEQEFNQRDIIIFRLLESQKNEILNLYTKDKFSVNDNDLIDNLIDYGVIETDDIIDHWRGWARLNHNIFLTDEVYDYFIDFDEHYDNGKTHPENWESFMSFYNEVRV